MRSAKVPWPAAFAIAAPRASKKGTSPAARPTSTTAATAFATIGSLIFP
jgi:hypothetical protein